MKEKTTHIKHLNCKSFCGKQVAIFLFALFFAVNLQAQNNTITPNFETENIIAGTLKEVRFLLSEATENTNYTLVWNGKFTSQILSGKIKDKALIFEIPNFLHEQAGKTEIIVLSNKKAIYKNSFYISASEAVGIIDAFIGPKTVNVDTLQTALIINIPKDKYQNPIDDAKLVTSQIKFPNANLKKEESSTENLVSYVLIQPKAQVGKIVVGTTIEKANSKEQEVKIEAGAPQNIQLAIVEQYPYADERQQTIFTSNILRDKTGAIIADGTNVDFLFDFAGTENTFKSYTVNGIASVAIQNPKEAGTINVKAVVYPEIYSNNLALNYESAIKEIVAELDNNIISVGPISNRFGQLFTNGVEVKFTLNPGNHQFSEALEDGKASFELNDKILSEIKPSECIINIAGTQKKLLIESNE